MDNPFKGPAQERNGGGFLGPLAIESETAPEQPARYNDIRDFPEVYNRIRSQAGEAMVQSLQRAGAPETPIMARPYHAGMAALHGLGFAASPLSALTESTVENPVTERTGSPLLGKTANVGASFALPIPQTTRLATEAFAPLIPKAGQLIKSYVTSQKLPEMAATTISADAAKPVLTEAAQFLASNARTPSNAKETYGVLEQLANPPNGELTPAFVEKTRQLLNFYAGGKGPDASAAIMAKPFVDRLLEQGAPQEAALLAEARTNAAHGYGMQALDDRLAKASLGRMAGQEDRLKRSVQNYLSSSEASGLSDQHRRLLEGFVNGNLTRGALQSVENALTSVPGLAASIKLGPAPVVAGMGIRMIGNKLAREDAGKLSSIMASDSPLGQQLQASFKSFSRWVESTPQKGLQEMTPRAIAMIGIEARNLSNNLKDAGISMSPDEIVNSAFEAMKNGQQEQPTGR